MNLKDKTVVVTGAGSGIGKATALLFASHGAKVIVSDINEQSAREVADQILMSDGKATAVKTDVTKSQEVESLISQMLKSMGDWM